MHHRAAAAVWRFWCLASQERHRCHTLGYRLLNRAVVAAMGSWVEGWQARRAEVAVVWRMMNAAVANSWMFWGEFLRETVVLHGLLQR